MLQINKGLLALSMLIAFRLSAMNQVALIHEKNDFRVETEEGSFPIQRCFIDKELRGISQEKLSKLIAADAYLKLSKTNDSNDYTLRLGGRLNGGGPVTAGILYWTVKGLGYGVPAGIAVATIAPIIPAIAAPAVTAATTGAITAVTTTAAAGGALAAGAGTAVAAGMVAGETIVAAVGAEAAATAAVGVMGAGGATTAYIAGVESASTGAFAVGMACWFLP